MFHTCISEYMYTLFAPQYLPYRLFLNCHSSQGKLKTILTQKFREIKMLKVSVPFSIAYLTLTSSCRTSEQFHADTNSTRSVWTHGFYQIIHAPCACSIQQVRKNGLISVLHFVLTYFLSYFSEGEVYVLQSCSPQLNWTRSIETFYWLIFFEPVPLTVTRLPQKLAKNRKKELDKTETR